MAKKTTQATPFTTVTVPITVTVTDEDLDDLFVCTPGEDQEEVWNLLGTTKKEFLVVLGQDQVLVDTISRLVTQDISGDAGRYEFRWSRAFDALLDSLPKNHVLNQMITRYQDVRDQLDDQFQLKIEQAKKQKSIDEAINVLKANGYTVKLKGQHHGE